jgi:hypothetical protein
VILDHNLTQAASELTPTFKTKRAFVYERYANVFNALYEHEAGHSDEGLPRRNARRTRSDGRRRLVAAA